MGQLEQRTDAWRRLLAVLPDEVIVVDAQGVIHHVGASLDALTGYRDGELIGRSIETLIPPEVRQAHHGSRTQYASDPRARTMGTNAHYRLLRKDHAEVLVSVALSPFSVDDRAWVVAAVRAAASTQSLGHRADMAERLTSAALLAESEERFRLAFEANTSPMIFVDLEDCITAANDAFCRLIGRDRSEIVGFDSSSFTHPDDQEISGAVRERFLLGDEAPATYVKRYVHRDGHVVIVEVSKSPARDAAGRVRYFVVSERDVTEERLLVARLTQQALKDPLTGLANRTLFEDRLNQAKARLSRLGGLSAVLLLDLDDFKGVNDTFGHFIGDQLLAGIARRFELVTRSTDTLSHLGADEFLYLAEDLASFDEAATVARRLLDVLAEPFVFDGMRIDQRATVGIALCDRDSVDTADLLQEADVARYEAKRTRRGSYVVFHPAMRQSAVYRFSLVQELHVALANKQLSMHYQPIVELASGRVVAFESLMRWRHPERGAISPEVFIPLAERSSLIVDLGAFALGTALNEARRWPASRGVAPYVSVNISAEGFHDDGLVGVIEDALSESGVAPERLVIEITESAALRDVTETLVTTKRLQELGVRVALDDFGTGYSSLSQLTLLRPDILKIDRSFVSPPHASEDHDALLEAVVTLGAKMGMTVLAEGIETAEQWTNLHALGCTLGQGFHFSPAVARDQVGGLIAHAYLR